MADARPAWMDEYGERLMPILGGPRHGHWAPHRQEGARITTPTAAWVPPANFIKRLVVPEELGFVDTWYESRKVMLLGEWLVPAWVHESLLASSLTSMLLMDVLVAHSGGEARERDIREPQRLTLPHRDVYPVPARLVRFT